MLLLGLDVVMYGQHSASSLVYRKSMGNPRWVEKSSGGCHRAKMSGSSLTRLSGILGHLPRPLGTQKEELGPFEQYRADRKGQDRDSWKVCP